MLSPASHIYDSPHLSLLFKRVLVSLLIVFPFLTSDAFAEHWSAYGNDYPYLQYSTEAAVVDEQGNVLYSLNGYNSMPMASTTKIMTAVVAIESGMPLDTIYVVTDIVNTVYGQVIGYQPGDQATLGQLLWGLLVYSGNDAAVCIAECVGGSVESFVGLMNETASRLGLNSTHYANPHGLDEAGHYSSPIDLITLTRHATQYQLFNDIAGSHYAVLPVSGEQRYYESTDALNGTYPGIQGIKTGYTYDAGNCFVGKATRGGVTIYMCVLGCELSEQRWDDSRTLFDWAFSHYPETSFIPSSYVDSQMLHTDNLGWSVCSFYPQLPSLRTAGTNEMITAYYSRTLSGDNESSQTITLLGSDGDIVAVRSNQISGVSFSTPCFGPVISTLFR